MEQTTVETKREKNDLSPTEATEGEGLRFQCSACGKCCTLWQVGLDAARGNYLLKQPWVQQRLASFKLHFLPDNSTGGYTVPHRTVEQGESVASHSMKACVFLNEQQHCLIQVNEGSSAKPLDCQSYPFASIGASVGASIGISIGASIGKSVGEAQTEKNTLALEYEVTASCLSVAERLLSQFQTIVPAPAEAAALQETLQSKQAKKLAWQKLKRIRLWPPPLEWWQTMPWPEWERRMQALHNLFKTEADLSPWQALYLAKGWLLHPKANEEAMTSLLHKALQRPTEGLLPFWRYALERLCLRRPFGLYSLGQLLWGAAYYDAAAFGAKATGAVATGVPWRSLTGITYPKETEVLRQQKAQLRAFLLLLLRRRVAMVNHQAWLGQWSLAIAALVLVEWYARAFALQEGELVLQKHHLTAAIRLVERFYSGHQPRWLALFRYHPFFGFMGLWLLP